MAREVHIRTFRQRRRRHPGIPMIVYVQTEPSGPYRSAWVFGFEDADA